MASKVRLNKISQVASPYMMIGEDQVDQTEIEESMKKVELSDIDHIETFQSTPMSQAVTILNRQTPTPDKRAKGISNIGETMNRSGIAVFDKKRRQYKSSKEALMTALSCVRKS